MLSRFRQLAANELEVALGEEDDTSYITTTHIADLKTTLGIRSYPRKCTSQCSLTFWPARDESTILRAR